MNTRWEYDIHICFIYKIYQIFSSCLYPIYFNLYNRPCFPKRPSLTNLLYVPKYQTNCNRISNSILSNERTSFQSATNSWVSVPQTNHVPGFCKKQNMLQVQKTPLHIKPVFTTFYRVVQFSSRHHTIYFTSTTHTFISVLTKLAVVNRKVVLIYKSHLYKLTLST